MVFEGGALVAEDKLYLCVNCLIPAEEAGVCEQCGGERILCRPGDSSDPCRRPLMDADGRIRSRAPIWWLKQRVGRLIDHLDIG
jgi:hypothetical protein